MMEKHFELKSLFNKTYSEHIEAKFPEETAHEMGIREAFSQGIQYNPIYETEYTGLILDGITAIL